MNQLIDWSINQSFHSLKKEDSDMRFVNNDLHTTSRGMKYPSLAGFSQKKMPAALLDS